MGIKLIAIGNRIMGDDSIGIKVVEHLSDRYIKGEVEIIIAETDIDYPLSCIENGDFVLIVDATYLNQPPGTVTFEPLQQSSQYKKMLYSQHQPNLIDMLEFYQVSAQGFVIGIEIGYIGFTTELSNELQVKFIEICEQISRFIDSRIRRS